MSVLSDVRGRPLYLENQGLDFLRLKAFIEDVDVQEPLLNAVVPIPVVGDLGQVKIDAAILEVLGSANATLSSALGRLYIQWQSDLEIVYLKELIAFATDPILAQLDAWDALGYIAAMWLPMFPARATPTGLPEGTTLLNAALSGAALNGTITAGPWVTDANGLDAIDFDALTTLITVANDPIINGVNQLWTYRATFAGRGEFGQSRLINWALPERFWVFRVADDLQFILASDTVDANSQTDNNEINFFGLDALVMTDFDNADVLGNGRVIRHHEALAGVVRTMTLATETAMTGTFDDFAGALTIGNNSTAARTIDATVNMVIEWTAAAIPFLDGPTGIYQTLTDLTGV